MFYLKMPPQIMVLLACLIYRSKVTKNTHSVAICFRSSSILTGLYAKMFAFTNLWKQDDLSYRMRKPTICIDENKDADQLRGNREADQRLCFHYTDSTTPLLKSEISSF